MRRLAILAAAPLAALAACGPVTVQSASSRTVTAADALYTAASIVGGRLADAGVMTPARYRALDDRAYAILLEVRAGRATLEQLRAVTDRLEGGLAPADAGEARP